MAEPWEILLHALPIGIGATAVMDIWAVIQSRWLGVPSLDFRFVGRWLAHMARGRFRHDSIAAASSVHGEAAIGWTAHYLVGIVFAAVLLGVWGMDWVRRPTLSPALIVGIVSIGAPFLLMQPAMGAGIAARRTPHPATARLRSFVAHASFGIGLYIAALLMAGVRSVG